MKGTDIKPNDDVSEAKWFFFAKLPKNLSGANNAVVLSKLKKYV